MRNRALFRRRDLLFCGAALLAGLLLWLCLSGLPRGTVAVVERNGKELRRQELAALTQAEEATFQGEGGLSVTVEFSPEGARVKAADCPDQVCVRTGRLTRAGESAVCLPAKISLRLEGDGADAETY